MSLLDLHYIADWLKSLTEADMYPLTLQLFAQGEWQDAMTLTFSEPGNGFQSPCQFAYTSTYVKANLDAYQSTFDKAVSVNLPANRRPIPNDGNSAGPVAYSNATSAETPSNSQSSHGQGLTASVRPRPRWVKNGITRPPIRPIIAATSHSPPSTP